MALASGERAIAKLVIEMALAAFTQLETASE
jgi:hypothetical protein